MGIAAENEECQFWVNLRGGVAGGKELRGVSRFQAPLKKLGFIDRHMNFHRFSSLIFCLLWMQSPGQVVEITNLGVASQTTEWAGGLYPAGNAVDGDSSTFSHTDSPTRDNHWELAFDEDHPITRVELQMRVDCCGGRLNGATLRLFDGEGDSVYDAEIEDRGAGQVTVFDIPEGTEAKRLRVGLENGAKNPGTNNSLIHLAEVRVFSGQTPRTEIESFTADRVMISSGESVMLSWATKDADEVTLSGVGSVALIGAQSVSPTESTIYQLIASSDLGTVVANVGVIVDGDLLDPLISEFMASNSETLLRSDGSSPDWIEIWNPNPVDLDLAGFQLADQLEPLTVFSFPESIVPAGGYLVVDAAEAPVDGVLATGFELNRDAEGALILRSPGGVTLQSFVYPRQRSDVSYGPFGSGNLFFQTPTPGGTNSSEGVIGFVADTRFSLPRGFYNSAQVVEVTTETPDAEIHVTLDGSEPGPGNASSMLYGEPILITETTILRARAFKEGFEPTEIDTQTYLFPADVSGQSSTPENFPPAWIPNLNVGVQRNPVKALSHYGFNNTILGSLPMNDAQGRSFGIEDALRAIPTMSLVVDADELFDPVDGLHINASQRGRTWERPASIEFLDPESGETRQANCGIRMHGGWNRFPEMLKKSFRLYFRPEYGDGDFEVPLFENAPTDDYDRLILRSGNGKAWTSPWRALSGSGNSLTRTTYFRDQFARDLQAETGQDHVPGNFVHLYINGHYWGLYNPVERADEYLAAGHFGGDEDDYDVIKWQRGTGHRVAAGDDDGWNELIALVRGNTADQTTYESIKERLDLGNLADYLLVNYFLGNQDWVDNNVYAMRNRVTNGPFRFYCWDGEETLLSTGRNSTTQNVSDTCTEIHHRLKSNPEYRLLFADRAQKHLFNAGALTVGRTDPIVAGYAEKLDRAIVGESARWGELNRPSNPYDRADWLAEIQNIRNNYLPNRGATLINQLRGQDLFPDVDAPEILPSLGGNVAAGSEVTFSLPADEGTVYYTTDGSDPRLEGGNVNPEARAFGSMLEQASLISLEENWDYLDTGADLGASSIVAGAEGYGSGNWKHPDFDTTAWKSGPAPLGYGGISGQTIATTIDYGPSFSMRHRTSYFRHEFPVTNASGFDSLLLRFFRDDGAVVYLNGVEVARSGFDPGVVVTSSSLAAVARDEGGFFEFEVAASLLVEGTNVIAMELHQATDGSSDLGFDLELIGENVVTTSEPIEVSGGVLVKSRVLNEGVWSPLVEGLFNVGDRGGDLVLGELMYHPADGGAEYLEIWNRGPVSHSLVDLKLSGGISFDFENSSRSSLGAGERLVLVREADTFSAVYPTTPVGGDYDGALANGGETLTLETKEGEVLWTITYGDDAPWPASADGVGRSLVYRGGPKGDPGSWRPSASEGGNPGASDSIEFAAGSDPLEYALVSYGKGTPGEFEVTELLGADDAAVEVQWSPDMRNWSGEGLELFSTDLAGNEIRNVWRVRSSDQLEKGFFRIKVTIIER